MNASFFHDMLGSIAERGRALLERTASRPEVRAETKAPETLESLSRALLSGRGEASGVALARQLLDRYAGEPIAGADRVLPAAGAGVRSGPRRDWPRLGRLSAGHLAAQPARPAGGSGAAPAGAVPAAQPGAGRNRRPGRHARGPDPAWRQRAGPAQGRRRLRAPVRLLVQPRLSAPAPDRLVDAGRHPGADHPLRGRARDPGLGRPAPPRPALATGAASPSSIRRWSTSR